ncbi:MAG TPA: histidine kinase [Saprospiraceae bacterium]|nr:histidine kinase [Saprospiraceae bacterium]
MQLEKNIKSPFNTPLVKFIVEPRFRWLRHTLFIILGLLLAFKGDIGIAEGSRPALLQKQILIVDALSFLFILGEIYFLLLVLVPKFLFRSKVWLFAIGFLILISLMYLFVWYVDMKFLVPNDDPVHPVLQHLDLSVLHYVQVSAVAAVLLAAVVGAATFKKWFVDVKRMNELQEINLRTELEQLKSQVNPHFLFNTLNNLMVLTKTDQEKATQVLLGLSDLLRYQLYDSARDKILLSKDIAFIENLLSLEKIRKNDFDFSINTSGDISNTKLPPFMFIPFVENAIKHGASTIGHSYLRISFLVENGQLHFTSENSKPAVKQSMVGGIGLVNIKRRLELLYPGTHTLKIADEKDKYIVNLSFPV